MLKLDFMTYRREIEGLRALAVMPVLFFHAGFEIFEGGYIGVDIFFVISGFLITNIIISELNSDQFSIVRFYERRARRLLPGLYFVILLTIPFSVAFMRPADLASYFESMSGVALFVSNFVFWYQSGYFDPAAELKPLLHTWSLAVEEQFYLFFPIVLLLVSKISKHLISPMLVLGILTSLIIAEWGWRNAYVPNFYLLPSRAWELLIGALCAYMVVKRNPLANEFFSAIGLIMILVSFFTINLETPVPSIYILVPVIGVSLILIYGREDTFTAKILSFRPIVLLGLISYSLYLFHQPIFAFFKLSSLTSVSNTERIFLIILSVICAYGSWRFIEKPFRNRERVKVKTFVFTALVFTFGFLLLSISHGNGAFNKTFSLSLLGHSTVIPHDFSGLEKDGVPCTNRPPQKACIFDTSQKNRNIILVGDSHARVLTEAAFELYRENNFSFLDLTGCPYFLGLKLYSWKRPIEGCDVRLQADRTRIMTTSPPATVVMSSRFSLYLFGDGFDNGIGGAEPRRNMQVGISGDEDFNERLELIRQSLTSAIEELSVVGHKVIIVGEAPGNGWDPLQRLMLFDRYHRFNAVDIKAIKRLMEVPRFFVDERQKELDTLFKKLAANNDKVFFIDLKSIFCSETHCQAITDGGEILYSDEDHLSSIAALKVFKHILTEQNE